MIQKIRAWLGRGNNFLYALFGFSLLVRLAYALPLPDSKISPDAGDWIQTAWSIAQGNGFSGSWRPPGYAFFLAGIFVLFGKSIAAARTANALLGALTCLLTYKTGKRIFSENTGRIAGVLTGFYPYFIAYTGDLLSETFLIFMLALAIYMLVVTAERPTWKNMAVSGVLVGLAGLTKSVVLPFFMLACAWLWWQTGKFRTGLMVGVFTLLAIAPWTLRNYYHYDKAYVMPVNTPWYSLYGAFCDEALQRQRFEDSDAPLTDAVNSQAFPKDWEYASGLPLPERDKFCKDKVFTWVQAHPAEFRYLLYKRLLYFWRLYPSMAYKWQKYAAMATSGIFIPLCLVGIVLSRRKFKKTSLLIALFAAYTAVHLFFAVTLRYRVPIDPYIIMFAAYALERAYGAFKDRARAVPAR